MLHILAVLALGLVGEQALACPALLFNNELTTPLVGRRSDVRLLTRVGSALIEQPIEIDPINHDGHLIFFNDESWRQKLLEPGDLILFRTEGWGPRAQLNRDLTACRGSLIIELHEPRSDGFAYLTTCPNRSNPRRFGNPVTFDPAEHFLKSRAYSYRFNPENYMQFREVGFDGVGAGSKLAAMDSQLYIHANVRNFFTMSFDSTDIESKMESYRLGPIGNLARISFFLKILFFKIKMSLSTDVGFFVDSAHIPMMINIPVDSAKYLNPGSGILYSWVPGPTARVIDTRMPTFNSADIQKGWEFLAKEARTFCSEMCDFRYGIEIGGKRLEMDLRFHRQLVERGFFPMYVDDVEKFAPAMGWRLAYPEGQKRSAMYFETSGLPKGSHPWDFWLRLGGTNNSSPPCPTPVRVKVISN